MARTLCVCVIHTNKTHIQREGKTKRFQHRLFIRHKCSGNSSSAQPTALHTPSVRSRIQGHKPCTWGNLQRPLSPGGMTRNAPHAPSLSLSLSHTHTHTHTRRCANVLCAGLMRTESVVLPHVVRIERENLCTHEFCYNCVLGE